MWKSHTIESYPQAYDEIYKDGIKSNKVVTYMVHNLGMLIMDLHNDNKWKNEYKFKNETYINQ